ncbi:MAG: DNA (cytosine-5-)-methyltransferase [Candidatus Marinimicrobia bacterium]|nr:DNA (cytosine-5-)-methyltransferase [Candidatus Neomarinimicrobiota bacterium]|tara:strand:+ start:91 stop:1065 length:975 start_codon:yes stop_codon:yes gene_type:complete
MADYKYKLIDLCAGTGAFSLAFNKTKKIKIVFSNDYCKNSKKIYDLNFNHKMTFGNINEINVNHIPEHDILTAGFPCQSWSIAGEQKGFDDVRSNVFWSIINIMKKHKPRVVILENVKNLQSHDKGNTFKIISENITKAGYFFKYKILNTCDITKLPQNRERIYIVCFKDKKMYEKFNFDFKKKKNKKIKDILENNINTKYYYSNRFKVWDEVKEGVKETIDKNIIYQYRRYYVRENKSNVCPTLTANMGTGGHNVPLLKDSNGIRKLIPKECFNLQGFPNNYKMPDKMSDSSLYKLAGNAVSVPVVKLIAKKVIKIMLKFDKK